MKTMRIHKGSQELTKLFNRNKEVLKIYYGTTAVWESNAISINTYNSSDYQYDSKYVSTDKNVFALNTTYTYNFAETNIDNGRMCFVTIPNNEFDSIEEVVIQSC